jgi:DNA-directed RNA polymerase beta' subunit
MALLIEHSDRGGTLKKAKMKEDSTNVVAQIKNFVCDTDGLKIIDSVLTDYLVIEQKLDKKRITLNCFDLEEVMVRNDEAGKQFLQVNFSSGKKILITETLVGFRPLSLYGLEMEKLPKVVTTPDIQSVFEAIQEALQSNDEQEELDVLRKVYDSVLCGGESVGFDLKEERKVFARIPSRMWQASA